MLHLGAFQGQGRGENFASRKIVGWSLASVVGERGVAGAGINSNAEVGTVEMNVMDKTHCSTYGMIGGLKVVFVSSYRAVILASVFDSKPDFKIL